MSMSMRRRRVLEPEHKDNEMPPRISAPSYRHASPSGPWPWMNIDSDPESDPVQLEPSHPTRTSRCSHGASCGRCWAKYPQSLFPNWTAAQVRRSGIKDKVAGSRTCVIHYVDVDNNGRFSETKAESAPQEKSDEIWSLMQHNRPPNNRVRALFVENLSVPMLQMLGTKYNIEPFFFSSSLNWIPSRFQEDVRPAEGDHITITLTFLRAMKVPVTKPRSVSVHSNSPNSASAKVQQQVIDTQLPLPLRSDDNERNEDQILLLDLLAIHMVRNPSPDSSTIISYHPSHDRRTPAQPHTSAKRLHSRIGLAGESVYWQNIFQKSEDPTFVLLTILWYALYAWDEALETLWEYICRLELSVIETNDMLFTQELHKIRAHLLHYSSLLEDFRKSVLFVLETPSPAMDSLRYDDTARERSRSLLKKECHNLLMEIERLSMSRDMQDKRLKNVMNLVFSSVNIEDSKRMQALTEAAVRDSAAMKQIAYLTMVFLPPSFCAGVFGMNIKDLNPDSFGTIAHYFATALPLTIATIWIIIAFQGKWHARDGEDEVGIWRRLFWPFLTLAHLFRGWNNWRWRSTALTIGNRGKAATEKGDTMANGYAAGNGHAV